MAKISYYFQDEIGENLNRYKAIDINTSNEYIFDLTRGATFTQIGTPLNANNLNEIVNSVNYLYDNYLPLSGGTLSGNLKGSYIGGTMFYAKGALRIGSDVFSSMPTDKCFDFVWDTNNYCPKINIYPISSTSYTVLFQNRNGTIAYLEDLEKYAEKTKLNEYLPLSGGNMSGTLNLPNFLGLGIPNSSGPTAGYTTFNKGNSATNYAPTITIYPSTSTQNYYSLTFPLKNGILATLDDIPDEVNLSQYVKGPDSATATSIARFSGTDGKNIVSSNITISSSGNMTIPENNYIQLKSVRIPISNGASTYGDGETGDVIMSNGSKLYWSNDVSTLKTNYNTLNEKVNTLETQQVKYLHNISIECVENFKVSSTNRKITTKLYFQLLSTNANKLTLEQVLSIITTNNINANGYCVYSIGNNEEQNFDIYQVRIDSEISYGLHITGANKDRVTQFNAIYLGSGNPYPEDYSTYSNEVIFNDTVQG